MPRSRRCRRAARSATTVDDGHGDVWLVRRVSQKTADFGVIAIDLGSVPAQTIDEVRHRVDDVLSDAAATLERLDVARALNDAKMRSETELLREALIGSVSHELRTPLASILGAATVLGQSAPIANDQRLSSLTGVVRDEAERLNNDIQNLLDATRISREQIKPRQEWIEPQDIVNSALARRRRRLSGHAVSLDMDANLPFVYVDAVLVEQAFVQIVDNAAKYSAPGAPIVVAAKRNGRDVVLSVHDNGIGLTAEENEQLGAALLPRRPPCRRDVGLRARPVDRQGLRRRQRRQDPGGERGRRSGRHGVDPAAVCNAREPTRGRTR